MPTRSESPSGCLSFLPQFFQRLLSPAGSKAASSSSLPYKRKDWLFTKAERSYFGALEQAVGGKYRIFAKVRLCDLLWLPKDCQQRQSHQNRINFKHVDFVICTLDEVKPVLVIELDDASHGREDRKARDAFLDAALAAAGLPVLHVPAKAAYSVAAIRGDLQRSIQPPSPPSVGKAPTHSAG